MEPFGMHPAMEATGLHSTLVTAVHRIRAAFFLLSGVMLLALASGASYRPF